MVSYAHRLKKYWLRKYLTAKAVNGALVRVSGTVSRNSEPSLNFARATCEKSSRGQPADRAATIIKYVTVIH